MLFNSSQVIPNTDCNTIATHQRMLCISAMEIDGGAKCTIVISNVPVVSHVKIVCKESSINNIAHHNILVDMEINLLIMNQTKDSESLKHRGYKLMDMLKFCLNMVVYLHLYAALNHIVIAKESQCGDVLVR